MKNCKLTGPSQKIKRRVECLVRVDSALEGLEIDFIPNYPVDKNDPVYKPPGPAVVTRSDRLLRSKKTSVSDNVS